MRRSAADHARIAWVFLGDFDGAVAPISFVISFFSNGVRIYGYPNSGLWYDLGFLIGICFWTGGGYSRWRITRNDKP